MRLYKETKDVKIWENDKGIHFFEYKHLTDGEKLIAIKCSKCNYTKGVKTPQELICVRCGHQIW